MANNNVMVTVEYISQKMTELIESSLLDIKLSRNDIDDFISKNDFYIHRSAQAMFTDYYNDNDLDSLQPNNNPPAEYFYEYYNEDLLNGYMVYFDDE